MKSLRFMVIVLAAGLSACTTSSKSSPTPGLAVDLLIRNARIIDGSGRPGFRGDVAVRNDRIVGIGNLKNLQATRTIDATGLVVAPGFIDVHTHADDGLYKQPQAENFVRDGVTTIVTGNCGYGVSDVAVYFKNLEKRGVALNVATLI